MMYHVCGVDMRVQRIYDGKILQQEGGKRYGNSVLICICKAINGVCKKVKNGNSNCRKH